MQTILESGLIWWITAIELPALSGLVLFLLKIKAQVERAHETLQETLELRTSQLREGLSAFKLEVAKTYASITDMKDLEMRIVGHLLRIEAKLDRTALATAALKATTERI